MSPQRILGFVLVAVGVLLLVFGFNATDSTVNRASEALTGQYTDRTMWFLVTGTAAAIGGFLLAAFGSRRRFD
ncbi:MAG: DUF3185 family protein [Candidatus Tectomicrobia bacterium]|uniref:DUF3185 family protein n=1 Tax=Tectimicrobiota bacterium TaxID=2528274 RepID=A0A932I3I5_UNCTE|nr:DUF3185 family protein [Candidatus Tectomicrobia bacterium]